MGTAIAQLGSSPRTPRPAGTDDAYKYAGIFSCVRRSPLHKRPKVGKESWGTLLGRGPNRVPERGLSAKRWWGRSAAEHNLASGQGRMAAVQCRMSEGKQTYTGRYHSTPPAPHLRWKIAQSSREPLDSRHQAKGNPLRRRVSNLGTQDSKTGSRRSKG